MAIIQGLDASFGHSQNGMIEADMIAAKLVADRLGEVIIFRSTGPWSKRWLERGYPSKNFHVKGKSSDWGPHAGLVSRDGSYSKVGANAKKAAAGSALNKDGLDSGFAGSTPLILKYAEIEDQIKRPEGRPPRNAVESKVALPNGKDFLLVAKRSGDQKTVIFRAFKREGDSYEIRVYPESANLGMSPFIVADKDPQGTRAVAFEVMTSKEVGAGTTPMTGDYDLMAVCPTWGQYGNVALTDIVKPGIELPANPGPGVHHRGVQGEAGFKAGVGMDNVMDPRLHTMGPGRDDFHPKGKDRNDPNRGLNWHDFKDRQAIYKQNQFARAEKGEHGKLSMESLKVMFDESPFDEHPDMGNLTPRILRCINELNAQMGAVGLKAPFRRVHHNAESHRFRGFAALTGEEMVTRKDGEQFGDGFPLTVFQPISVYRAERGRPLPGAARYGAVCTIETLQDFKAYAAVLKESGFYVPKNWIWGSGF